MDRSNFVGSLDPFLSGSGSGDKMNINQVPKSHSSSSGVNDISDSVSSTNSKEDLSSRNKKDSDVPTFGDVLDLLKFSYILQQTDLKNGDITSVPKGAQELWTDLKESLLQRPIMKDCYKGRQSICNCCDGVPETHFRNLEVIRTPIPITPMVRPKAMQKNMENAVMKRDKASQSCPVADVLSHGLDEVVRQGLLDSLLPFLSSSNIAGGCATASNTVSSSSAAVGSSGPSSVAVTSGGGQRSAITTASASAIGVSGSAAESSSKEEEVELYRPPSNDESNLTSMPASHRLSSNDLMRRTASSSTIGRMKSNTSNDSLSKQRELKKTREVVIHVCDETRDAKKDFTCPQDLLLSQMGYFRDITSGQSLEDVDISVHCDVTIFEWLMDWLKAQQLNGLNTDYPNAVVVDQDLDITNLEDSSANSEITEPELNANNVVSILVSASFLKMGPLVDITLMYLHQNMNNVLLTTHNLNCLGEPLLTRLSHLFKPTEVEELMDRRDRIHSRLYTKLICSLCEPQPQPDREIFQTAATLYRCKTCGLYLTQQLAKLLPCNPLRCVINRRGEVVPRHQRDPQFNLNDFLRSLRVELKSWRKVFWRLWGMCHSLYCSLCSSYFPVYMHEFCSFHPQDPDFPGIQFKTSQQPYGAFSCCQMAVYRFQPLSANQKGCQSRDHRVKLRNDSETKTFKVLMANRDLICLCPSRKSTIKINADLTSITLPPTIESKTLWTLSDELAVELSLIPSRTRRRGLVNRGMWENLRSNLLQGVLKKAAGNSLLSVIQAAKAMKEQNAQTALAQESKGRVMWGRLKKAPRLPTKPPIQSSDSSTDDLSGSEDSSSDDLDVEKESKDKEESNMPLDGGNGTEDDDDDLADDTKPKQKQAGDLSIEIKIGKDKDKSKTLLAGAVFKAMTSGVTGSKTGSTGAGNMNQSKPKDGSQFSMKWDPERTVRANQDYQREKEEMAMRDLLKHLARRQQHLQRQKAHQHQSAHPVSAFLRPVASAPNLAAGSLATPFGGMFMRLEQDWRETHMSYLQHRSATAVAQNSLAMPSRMTRPNSAASVRSSRYSRTKYK